MGFAGHNVLKYRHFRLVIIGHNVLALIRDQCGAAGDTDGREERPY